MNSGTFRDTKSSRVRSHLSPDYEWVGSGKKSDEIP